MITDPGFLLIAISLQFGDCQWFPQVPRDIFPVDSISPNWLYSGVPRAVQINSRLSEPVSAALDTITVQLSGPTTSYIILEDFHANDPFEFNLPVLQEAGTHCVSVEALVVPINGRTRSFIGLDGGANCFEVIPPITWLSARFSPPSGPPSGGTVLKFEFAMDQPWPAPNSPVYPLDCVFDTYRVPVSYSFPANPSARIVGTCTTPTILTENFDLCVNLVPRNTQLVLYPLFQDASTFTCTGLTIPFNFYPNMPETAETLDPPYINYDGIVDPVVIRISFPPSPQSMGVVRCRYGSDPATGKRHSGIFDPVTSTVRCNGAPPGYDAQLVIDPLTSYLVASIYVSFNNGTDYTLRAAPAYYNTEYFIDSIDPPIVPYTGGTGVKFFIFASGQVTDPNTLEIQRPKLFTDIPGFVCVFRDGYQQPVSIPITQDLSGDFMLGDSLPITIAFQTPDISTLTGGPVHPVRVSFFLPGTSDCQNSVIDGKTLSYRPDWQGLSVVPSVFTVNPPNTPVVFNVVGQNFFSYSNSLCRVRPILPPGSLAQSTLATNNPCDLIGTFTQVDSSSGTCTVAGKQGLFSCTYGAVKQGAAAAPSEAFLEYRSLLVEIAIANNGLDFIPISSIDAVSGSKAPLLVSAIRMPLISRVIPNFGFSFGGYSIEIELRSGVSWDVTKCVFTEDTSGISKTVDASIFSLRSVGCVVPQWRLLPGTTLTTFNVFLEISNTQLTAPVVFTMFEFPEIESAFPRVGPIGGGTEIAIVADQDSLNLLLTPESTDASFPTPISIQCEFESLLAVPALYDPVTQNLACAAPPASKVGLAAGGFATVDLNVNWLLGSDDTTTMNDRLRTKSVYQFVFRYQSVQFDVVEMGPLSGPIAGGTLVVIRTSSTIIPNTGSVYCMFGRIAVEADWRDDHTFWCTSPPVTNNGIVTFTISIDGGQTTSPFLFTTANIGNATLGSTGSSYFNYYSPPTVSILSPASGSTLGGTNVIVHGNNFSGTKFDKPKCRFGTVVVNVVLYMSSKILVCVSPAGTIGDVPVAVANNGVDFGPITDSSSFFEYTEVDAILNMHPLLGPKTGGTRVTISARSGILPSASSQGYVYSSSDPPRCEFGSYSVIATIINTVSGNIQCISPSVPSAITLNVIVYFNGQTATYAADNFLFYDVPSISSIVPPLGPQGVPNTLTLQGQNFVNSETLKVRFGTVNVGYIDIPGLFVSPTEIRVSAPVTSPSTLTRRLPVMISNNGVDFVPVAIEQWDPNNESLNNIVKYYTLHIPVALRFVYPQFADMHGGGYVSVYGGPFINTGGLGKCAFDSISAGTVVFISPNHILCPVPNMWTAGSSSALSRSTKLQVSLVGTFFSAQFLTFRFISLAPAGAFLPHASPTVFTSRTAPCISGHSCMVEGLVKPIQCAPGSYQPYPNQKACLPCPVGFYCSLARSHLPIPCDPGWVCDTPGLVSPAKICPPGFICLAGTATSDPIPNEPFNALTPSSDAYGTNGAYRCPLGMYCLGGVLSLVSKPGNYSTPQPCFPGAFCFPGSSSPYGSGLVPLGRFSATPKNPGRLCPPRFYCGPVTGSVQPMACPAGTFNAFPGQHNCTLAPEGSIAPSPMLARPIPSPCGYVAGKKGTLALGVNDLCPAGMTCGYGVAADSEPPICFTIDSTNTTLIQALCQSKFNQVVISGVPGSPFTRVDKTKTQCCWDSTRVTEWTSRIVKIFKASAYSNQLMARSAQGFSDSIAASPVNGLGLLESVNRDTLISNFKVNIGKVRDRILFEIERQYSFTLPEPCPAGTFCNAGTCRDYLTVITQP